MSALVKRAEVMDSVCHAVADAWGKKNVSVAGAIIDSINAVATAPDPRDIIRDLLEHAVYDREKNDECAAAVEAAEAYLEAL